MPRVSRRIPHPRPRLTCRVGVTGHRPTRLKANAANLSRLRERADEVLKAIADAVSMALHGDKRPTPYSPAPPLLRLISPLAEGSDRIVVRAGLELQAIPYELQCIFPFPVDIYQSDFTERSEQESGSLEEFNDLRKRASAVLELDSDPTAPNAYVAVGLTLVRQVDVLIAIWDTKEARGLGGTPEVVLEALRANIPVIGIDARGANDHAIAFIELQHGRLTWVEWSLAELAVKLGTVFILPPRDPSHERDHIAPKGKIDLAHALFDEPEASPPAATLYARVTRWASRLTGEEEFRPLLTPELDHFVHEPSTSAPELETAAGETQGLLSEEVRRDVPQPEVRAKALGDLVTRLEATIGAAYTWADLQANRYAALHRRHVTRSTLLLVPIAVVIGFVVQRCLNPGFIGDSPLAARTRVVLSFVELAAVVLIFSSYVTVREHRYHDRWLDYRSIAEKLRHILMLLPLGRPGIDAELPPTLGANDVRSHWTNWYVRAVTREAGVLSGNLHDAEYRKACHALLRHWLVRGQIRYHYFAAIKAHAPMHLLHKYRYVIFLFIVLSPMLDLVLEPIPDKHEHAKQLAECFLELVFFCFPAVMASWYGFTRLADFENIEVRSRAELQRLMAVERELSDRSDQSSVDLVHATAMTSHAMLAELVEWRIAAAQRGPDLGH